LDLDGEFELPCFWLQLHQAISTNIKRHRASHPPNLSRKSHQSKAPNLIRNLTRADNLCTLIPANVATNNFQSRQFEPFTTTTTYATPPAVAACCPCPLAAGGCRLLSQPADAAHSRPFHHEHDLLTHPSPPAIAACCPLAAPLAASSRRPRSYPCRCPPSIHAAARGRIHVAARGRIHVAARRASTPPPRGSAARACTPAPAASCTSPAGLLYIFPAGCTSRTSPEVGFHIITILPDYFASWICNSMYKLDSCNLQGI
jgi:hypothetical protein